MELVEFSTNSCSMSIHCKRVRKKVVNQFREYSGKSCKSNTRAAGEPCFMSQLANAPDAQPPAAMLDQSFVYMANLAK